VADSFPRSTDLPAQSPLFWVQHKDRYLRQLLIRDIQAKTSRALVVYFADCDLPLSTINGGDDIYIAELLNAVGQKPTDLLLETNGGNTDATEKICSLLRYGQRDLRVIVPRRAKSNGTVIALAGKSILMGMESELGPIDPSISNIPVQFVLDAPPGTFTPIDIQSAQTFRKQTEKLATTLLSTGMMQRSDAATIDALVKKIATRDTYHSHGSVIDADEAKGLGLTVSLNGGDDDLWSKVGLLRAMYQYDCEQQKLMKVFEGDKVSLVVPAPPAVA
jgi:ClpP class serine protease